MTDKQYRILNLHAENIKKIKVVDITTDPNSNTVIISGANGNGKSSVLDCIEMACRGGDTLPDMPIRRGQEKGSIELDLGDLKIKRTFTEKGSYLFVESPEGARYPQPQAMLDKMLGLISFDPLEFTRIKPKEQYETIKALVDLKDIEKVETKLKAYEEQRTEYGRKVKELTAQVAGMVVPDSTPEQPIDVSVKASAILKARQDRDTFHNLSLRAQSESNVRGGYEKQVRALEEQIKGLNVQISDALGREGQFTKEALEIKKILLTDEEIAVIQKDIDGATSINATVATRTLKATKEAELKAAEKVHADTEASIAKGRQIKADMIAEAKMPVKGLSLEDGQVFYKDIPLDQASTAEQIRVSTAIAMASNPALRVIRIKDASLLDDDSMEIIRDMAEKKDFQVWLEVVNSDDPMAVVIEDGEVRETVLRGAPGLPGAPGATTSPEVREEVMGMVKAAAPKKKKVQ